MENANVQALQQELERQDRELEELFRAVGAIDPRDIPPGFFDELEEVCRPRVAQPALAPLGFHPGLRA
jgi:hypothetical protein